MTGVPYVVRPFSHAVSEYKGDDMNGVRLTEHEKEGIYTMHCLGEKKADIADRYGIAQSTVYRIISEQRKKQEQKKEEGSEMAARSKIVAGDKSNGRLVSTTDPHRFEGTCVVGGKAKSRTFTAVNARNAEQQWEKWCKELRDEQAFMDMVERKPTAEVEVAEQADEQDEAKCVCGYHDDPIEEIRPVEHAEDSDSDDGIVAVEKEFEGTGVPLADTSEPAYLIWAKSPEPRCYGLYLTMESALREVDRLNDVAAFLGTSGAFEVEEVAWRG